MVSQKKLDLLKWSQARRSNFFWDTVYIHSTNFKLVLSFSNLLDFPQLSRCESCIRVIILIPKPVSLL